MYYDRILRIWVLDPVDIFLISALIGSFVGSGLREYLSEKKAMERLKSSIIKKSNIKKSKLISESKKSISKSKKSRIQKIYRLALENRGGQFENFQTDYEFSNEVWNLAQKIKGLVERLAQFLKERELKGVARIFFKNGRLLLELILCQCRIDITYALLSDGLTTQVIVMTATAGGAAGFAISWFSVGASLVAPPMLISMLLIRSIAQQIVNLRDYEKFKKLVKRMLDDDELKQTLQAIFIEEGEVPRGSLMEKLASPLNSDKNPLPKFDFDLQSDQTLEEFVKARMEQELGLVENPTPEQIQEIIQRPKRDSRPKGKTVYFRDLIDEIAEGPDDIIDAEIVKEPIREPIRLRVENEEL